ncbi:hypothetical protein [Chryseobacterium gleum]|uniref:hypothetical protein n=1 Tax=Chryseobacterium gleum TaxID=250 RepID=UPI001E35A6C2|nr:hypothetical protein [Chryseobacterium gleum]MCD9616072.1 hypothetical protein [Chryseobacterium gleum]
MITTNEILLLFGGGTVIAPAIVAFLAQRLADAQNNKWRAKTDEKLEVIKTDLTNKNNVLSNLMDVQKSNYGVSQQRRIEAIEKIWSLLNDFRMAIPDTYSYILNFINENEITDFSNYIKNVSTEVNLKIDNYIEDFLILYEDLEKTLKKERPFLGYEVWEKIYAFKNFIMISLSFTIKNLEKNIFKHWQNNEDAMNLLKSSLSIESANYICRCKQESFDMALAILESHIIESINNVLSGKIASHNTLEYIKTLGSIKVDNKFI